MAEMLSEEERKRLKAARIEESKLDILAKVKSMENTPLAAVYEILTCRPSSPMHVQWRIAFTALRARGFKSECVRHLTGIKSPSDVKACTPYPAPEVVQAFKFLLGGIPETRIFPCLKNPPAYQAQVAKDYFELRKRSKPE